MKLPLSWLKDFVNKDITASNLVDKLPGIGFEVEEVVELGGNLNSIVAGRIVSASKHQQADKLTVLSIDTGDKTRTVVTAAKNVAVGDVVPVSLPGCVLPSGKKIESGDLRGVISEGMLLSLDELAIPFDLFEEKACDKDGIYHLDENIVPGTDIKDALGLNDCVLDISITANRPDCQSVLGIAREIAVMYNSPLTLPPLDFIQKPAKSKMPPVKVSEHSACSRYTGTIIENASAFPSPKWMQNRLKMCGIRPINCIVDITNYVLLEVGQPLHAFDTRFIAGGITARLAKEKEKIVALDGNEYDLKPHMLVIADDKKPVAIAGVMGGEYSGIFPDTKDVFLEAAAFAKGSVRLTSRTLGLRSDSSSRFEKGINDYSVDIGRRRALHLFESLGVGSVTDAYAEDGDKPAAPQTIITSCAEISAILGIDIPEFEVFRILESLGFVVSKSGEKMTVVVPAHRLDVDNYTDLAEEVIRFYGYDHLINTKMETVGPTIGGRNVRQNNLMRVKAAFQAFGCAEVLTYSFINPSDNELIDGLSAAVAIQNPLSREFSEMRTQLISSLLRVSALNINRKNGAFRIFEQARVYHANTKQAVLPNERERAALVFYGKGEDFYSVKECVYAVLGEMGVSFTLAPTDVKWLHPGMGATLLDGNNNAFAHFGKIHPITAKAFELPENIFVAEIDFENIVDSKPVTVRFAPLPKYPAVERDLAVVVDEAITVGALTAALQHNAGTLLESVQLFDVYRGAQIEKGKKSVAFSLVFRSADKTLADADINAVMTQLLSALDREFNAKLREN